MAIKRHGPESGLLSNAVEAGGLVFCAGQVPDDLDLDIKGQTRQALANVDAALAQAGSSKAKIVSAQVWLSDMRLAPGYNEVWKEWVDPANLPARATVESRLYDPRCLIEIKVIAVK